MFCHFIYKFRISNIIVFFSWSQPLPRNIHSTGTCQTIVPPWIHVFIANNTGAVIIISYYFNPQSSFIKVEKVGLPETSRCLFTKLHGVPPTLQQPVEEKVAHVWKGGTREASVREETLRGLSHVHADADRSTMCKVRVRTHQQSRVESNPVQWDSRVKRCSHRPSRVQSSLRESQLVFSILWTARK